MTTTKTLEMDLPTLFARGRLCLDFVNTSFQVVDVKNDLLGTSEELRQWLRQAEGVLGTSFFIDDAVWKAGYGELALARALELRNALRELVVSVIEKVPPPVAAADVVNALLRENPTYAQISVGGDGFQDTVTVCRPEDKWLVAIAQDAVDLLCSGDLSLIRQCDCPTCIRVFYDTTKNHKRRWCVEKCGSKPKAAAYYRRKVAKVAQGKRAE